MTTASSPVVLF